MFGVSHALVHRSYVAAGRPLATPHRSDSVWRSLAGGVAGREPRSLPSAQIQIIFSLPISVLRLQ